MPTVGSSPPASAESHGTGPRAAQRLPAIVLGPRGGGTTRRRASDALRLGFAVVAVAVSIPVMRANSAVALAAVVTWAVCALPSPHLGMGDTRLDAAPRVRISR
jgi:hypothetical protein